MTLSNVRHADPVQFAEIRFRHPGFRHRRQRRAGPRALGSMRRNLARIYRSSIEYLSRPRSFRAYLAAATLFVLIPINLAVIIVMASVQTAQRHRIVTDIRAVVELGRSAFDSDIMHWRADLQALAMAADGATALPYLDAYRRTHPAVLSLALIDRDGAILALSGRTPPREALASLHAAAFAPGAASAGNPVSLRVNDPEGGTPLIGLATPSGATQLARAVVALVRLDDAGALRAQINGHQGWRLAITGQDGAVLAASNRALIGQTLALPGPAANTAAQAVIAQARIDGARRYLAAVNSRTGPWLLLVSVPAADMEPSLHDELNWVLLAGVLLVLPLMVNFLIGHRLGRQLVTLADAARAVSHEEPPRPMRRTMIRELNAVQRTLRIASALMRERVEARARVRRMREGLERAQRMESVGQAMAGVAHDFGNLIFVIAGNLEQLQHRLGDRPAERAMLDTALRLTGEAKQLVALLSSGGRHSRREPCELDVGESIAELTDLLRDVAGESVRFAVHVAPGLPHCYLDPILFKSALCNLAINARTAMPRGGEIRIEAGTIRLSEAEAAGKNLPPGDYIVVAVSDSGVGIPPTLMSRIFDPFVTTEPAARGAGLGLSIVYGFVRASGGHVEVTSDPGRRTTFSMYFPAIGTTSLAPSQAQNAAS